MKKSKGKYNWPKSDIKYMEENFPHVSNKELAAHFCIGWRSVVRKARELGLVKSETFRDNIDFIGIGSRAATNPNSIATRIKKGERRGAATQYKPGNTPWLKGKTIFERLCYRDKITPTLNETVVPFYDRIK